ncbi:MAG: hypothetical protein M1825_005620 [Sarcosagium campestre]|nr:MAG: hypothetical protein M1825_005620 [Sarcosagium campestre]
MRLRDKSHIRKPTRFRDEDHSESDDHPKSDQPESHNHPGNNLPEGHDHSESDHSESDHPESHDNPESDHPESDHPESDHPASHGQSESHEDLPSDTEATSPGTLGRPSTEPSLSEEDDMSDDDCTIRKRRASTFSDGESPDRRPDSPAPFTSAFTGVGSEPWMEKSFEELCETSDDDTGAEELDHDNEDGNNDNDHQSDNENDESFSLAPEFDAARVPTWDDLSMSCKILITSRLSGYSVLRLPKVYEELKLNRDQIAADMMYRIEQLHRSEQEDDRIRSFQEALSLKSLEATPLPAVDTNGRPSAVVFRPTSAEYAALAQKYLYADLTPDEDEDMYELPTESELALARRFAFCSALHPDLLKDVHVLAGSSSGSDPNKKWAADRRYVCQYSNFELSGLAAASDAAYYDRMGDKVKPQSEVENVEDLFPGIIRAPIFQTATETQDGPFYDPAPRHQWPDSEERHEDSDCEPPARNKLVEKVKALGSGSHAFDNKMKGLERHKSARQGGQDGSETRRKRRASRGRSRRRWATEENHFLAESQRVGAAVPPKVIGSAPNSPGMETSAPKPVRRMIWNYPQQSRCASSLDEKTMGDSSFGPLSR